MVPGGILRTHAALEKFMFLNSPLKIEFRVDRNGAASLNAMVFSKNLGFKEILEVIKPENH